MTSLRAGYQTYTSYNQQSFVPLTVEQWDNDNARLLRYHHNTLYYYNYVYSSLETYRIQHLRETNHGLYRSTRAIYNPVARLCDLYSAKVYGGMLDMLNGTTGAIPLVNVTPQQTKAILQLWRWSNWQNEKSVFALTGAMQGDVFINVVDDRAKRKVRLEVLPPGLFRDVQFDNVGNIKSCVICYPKVDPITKHSYTFELRIDQEKFATFRDNNPVAFYEDANGRALTEWKNEYGFVPCVHIPHRRMGTRYGMSAFHTVLGKIDEMNSVASAGHDQIRKTVNAAYQWAGGKGSIQFEMNEDKGNIPIITTPENTELKPLVTQIDLMAVANAVDAELREIERDMPELALHRIREGGNLTAPGVRAAYTDAIGKINEVAANYDNGVVRAHQMAMTIGGIGGYSDFEPFNINSYENGDLEHNIGDRPVIDDTLSKTEKITFLMQVKDQPPTIQQLVFQELGVSDEQIEAAQKDAEKMKDDALEEKLLTIEATNAGMISAMAAQQNRRGIQAGENGAVVPVNPAEALINEVVA